MPDAEEIETLAAIVQDVADAVIIVRADGTVAYANRATAELLGHPADTLVGQHYEVLIPPDARPTHREHHDRFVTAPTGRTMGESLVLRAHHAAGYDIDVTIALVPIAKPSPMIAAIIRELTTSQREIGRLAATNELLTSALGGAGRAEVELLAVRLALELLDADATVLSSEDETLATSGDADAVARPAGATISVASTVVIGDHPLTLTAHRPTTARGFAELDQRIVDEFTAAIAITLELLDARAEVAALRSIADHDRIARDLHDRVIQRLFAVAMDLESLASASTGLTRSRLAGAVEALDEVIREIRTTIFGLRDSVGPPRLRVAVANEIDDVAQRMGFAPSLRFLGSTDDSIDTELGDSVVAVVRELLSNACRHAHARHVDVVVGTIGDEFVVQVDDDGTGLPDATDAGDGLVNIERRARELGGSFDLLDRPEGGVRAEWRVPFTPGDAAVST
jgi:PAS domain S-box-containing protein